jgi:hypothetical protein
MVSKFQDKPGMASRHEKFKTVLVKKRGVF